MIIFGWNTYESSSKRPKDIQCFSCGSIGEMFVRKHVKVCQLYFMPIFPYAIWSEVECVRCKSYLQLNNLSPELEQLYGPYKPNILPKLWHLTGLLIIFGLLGWAWFSTIQHKNLMKARVDAIEVGRVIDFQTANKNYSTFKICDQVKDTLFVVYNKFEVDNKTGLSRIFEPTFYSKDTVVLNKNELIEWINDGKVKDVHW